MGRRKIEIKAIKDDRNRSVYVLRLWRYYHQMKANSDQHVSEAKRRSLQEVALAVGLSIAGAGRDWGRPGRIRPRADPRRHHDHGVETLCGGIGQGQRPSLQHWKTLPGPPPDPSHAPGHLARPEGPGISVDGLRRGAVDGVRPPQRRQPASCRGGRLEGDHLAERPEGGRLCERGTHPHPGKSLLLDGPRSTRRSSWATSFRQSLSFRPRIGSFSTPTGGLIS